MNKIELLIYLWHRKRLNNHSLSFTSFRIVGWDSKLCATTLNYFDKSEKKWTWKMYSASDKKTLFQKKSALKQRCSALILLLWKDEFWELMRAESSLLKDFLVMCNAESEPEQRWLALIILQTERIIAEILWNINPGNRVLSFIVQRTTLTRQADILVLHKVSFFLRFLENVWKHYIPQS